MNEQEEQRDTILLRDETNQTITDWVSRVMDDKRLRQRKKE